MTSTSAERQRRYRQRHLKDVEGTKSRLQAIVDYRTVTALRRMALHTGESITHVVDRIVLDAEKTITDNLSASAYNTYKDAAGLRPAPSSAQQRYSVTDNMSKKAHRGNK